MSASQKIRLPIWGDHPRTLATGLFDRKGGRTLFWLSYAHRIRRLPTISGVFHVRHFTYNTDVVFIRNKLGFSPSTMIPGTGCSKHRKHNELVKRSIR